MRDPLRNLVLALDKSIEEAGWLQNFLENISCWEKPVPDIMIHCIACRLWESNMYSGKSQQIRQRHNTIRQFLISNDVISLEYAKSTKNIADPLTKGIY